MTVPSAWLATVVLVTLVGTARSSPIELGVGPGLPFTTEQLEQALASRVGDSSIARLTVTAHGEGAADIAAGGLTRVVPFGDRTGYAAARVVALAIYDLLLVEATPPALARLDDRANAVLARPMVQLAALAGAMKGAGTAQPLGLALSVALTWPVSDRLCGRVSAGSWWVPEGEPTPANAGLQAWPLRISAGLRRGGVDLVAGPIVMPYVLSGTVHTRGVVAGAGASADAGLRVSRGMRLVASGGLDVFANRVEVRNNREPIFSTPRVALSVALGLAIEVGR
jgi:hypothetical protein